MSSELSVFRKMNTVGLYILCKAEPPAWSQTTVLLRCLTRENQELCIIATRDAVDTLRNLETLRAYEMGVAGTCVKANNQGQKNGVYGQFEVRLVYAPKVSLAKDAWPLAVPYSFVSFPNMNQKSSGDFVDLIGRVRHAGPFQAEGLQKREVELQNEDERVC